MTMRFGKMLVCTSLIGAAFASTGCKKDEPSRWEPAAKTAETASSAKAVATTPPPPVAAGGTLNTFFPPEAVDGKKRLFTAEKDGYVEAKLLADGKQVALLGVNDFNGKADDIAKFDKATEKLGEFPLLMPTKKQTSILVGKRYQVKVTSDSMTPEERKALLEKFNLKGLASFVPPTK